MLNRIRNIYWDKIFYYTIPLIVIVITIMLLYITYDYTHNVVNNIINM